MEQYNVTGMSCAACSARVEKAVQKVPGVTACSVSLLTNSMGVEGTADPQAILAAVQAAGYGASPKSSNQAATAAPQQDTLSDQETPKLKRRLFSSLFFLLLLMYLSMGHVMWNWPLPVFLAENPIAIGLCELLLTTIVLVINQRFFTNGYRALLRGAPNMDTLVALGATAAVGYSIAMLFSMSAAQLRGDTVAVLHCMHEFYFESAAMILTLITVGKLLEARAKGKTTNALKSLLQLAPETASVERNGSVHEIPVAQVQSGDIFLVRPGAHIPVDGTVLEGNSAIDESALTGESIPVDKAPGDSVSAATTNCSGFLRCRASRVGADTTLAQIIQMVSDAAATKAPIAKIADKVSGVFVPVVISIAAITILIWLLTGQSIGYALARGISVLVISCPCALGLATPVAIMVGSGVGARHGILFKTAAALEHTGKITTIALDKTGTITAGMPQVTDLLPAPGFDSQRLLQFACSLESKSEHPLARAVLDCAAQSDITPEAITQFQARPGNGLLGQCGTHQLAGGNATFIQNFTGLDSQIAEKAADLAAQGKTPLFFSCDQELVGIIAVADVIKKDSTAAIAQLQNMGLRVVMLTGDNEKTAQAIGKLSGVDEVIAGVLPGDKQAVIQQLAQHGPVAMVGDGINDAPALTQADTGIAIGAGADVAIDAADVVLMKSSLTDVPAAIRLSRATLRNIRENLFWAFIYNMIGIPLAAGVFIPVLNWQLNPMFGAAAMSLSSFCVVSNALRLNLFSLYDSRRDHKIYHHRKKEKTVMTKTLKIEGMMCPHCEARVQKALEALPEVVSAAVSHKDGTAIVTLSASVADDVLKQTVQAQDYPVTEIL